MGLCGQMRERGVSTRHGASGSCGYENVPETASGKSDVVSLWGNSREYHYHCKVCED